MSGTSIFSAVYRGPDGGPKSRQWRSTLAKYLTAAMLLMPGWETALAQDLTIRLQDWARIPLSGDLSASTGNPTYLTRANFLREEPNGTGRMWLCDLNGSLYLFARAGDLNSRSSALQAAAQSEAPYLDFNGNTTSTSSEQNNVPNSNGTSTTQKTPTGIFRNFTKQSGYANGLVTFQFNPAYATNGKFYTVHIEMTSSDGSASRIPLGGPGTKHPNLNVTGYTSTPVVNPPSGSTMRQAVLIEWTDTNTANTAFEGTARELLRLGFNGQIHPLGDLIFHPLATDATHPERGMMYLAVGDGGAGESGSNDDGISGMSGGDRHHHPQRLDSLVGKILRIVPDLTLHTGSSAVSPNGRYRIPNDNPFTNTATYGTGVRKEIWAYGFRNPHRLSWDIDPADASPLTNRRLFAMDIGLNTREEVNVVKKGANYGYAEREGSLRLIVTSSGRSLEPVPTPDTLPVRLNATATAGTVTPVYPVVEYSHTAPFGDAISSGFVYRGSNIPALRGKFVFGDITTGRLFYVPLEAISAADDGVPTTTAAIQNLNIQWDDPYDSPNGGMETYGRMFEIVSAAYHGRGGPDGDLPGGSTVSGTGRADVRLAVDAAGELLIISKSDGMVRAVAMVPSPTFTQEPKDTSGNPGTSVKFTGAVSSDPPASLRWERQAAGSDEWLPLNNGGAYSGVTTTSLTISGIAHAMNDDRFRLVADNGSSPAAASSPAKLTVPSPFEVWRQTEFTPAQLEDPTISGPGADPDVDGLDNDYEYSFALPPLSANPGVPPMARMEGGLLTLEFDAPRSELDYVVKVTTDLKIWTTEGVVIQRDGTRITATFTPGGETKAFLRVFVSPKP